MKVQLTTALVASSLLFALPLQASQDNLDWGKGWYIGAGINRYAEFTDEVNGPLNIHEHLVGMGITSVGLSSEFSKLTSENVGFDAYLGREISRHFAAELGYNYVGNIHYNGTSDGVRVESATFKQWNMHLVGLGRLPLGYHVDFMVKGGVAWYYNGEKFEDLVNDVTTHAKFHSYTLTYGAGLEVAWDQFILRGEYTVISPVTSELDDFYIADIIGGSLIYKFM